MEKVTFPVLRVFIFLFGLLPFRAVYLISDGLSLIVQYVIRYRTTVVTKNLKNAFPEKSNREIRKISRNFYRHFCDVFMESIKSFSMSENAILKRFVILNPEEIDGLYDQGIPVIVVAGHYNNWEWAGIAADKQIRHKPIGFYKPLSNKEINNFLLKTRVKGRSILASINKTAETFQVYRDEPVAFYMIADQRPSSVRFAHWMPFMNQDTPFLNGPEKYAKIYNYPVFYVEVQKVKRGYYQVRLIKVNDDPVHSSPGEITRQFKTLLEESIKKSPQYYLWTHDRWKFSRQQEK